MDKTVVKEHIVLAAAKSFAQKGVKTVRMDDIAAGLSISKRTLYELFHDKEDLLLDVMKLHREEMQEGFFRYCILLSELLTERLSLYVDCSRG